MINRPWLHVVMYHLIWLSTLGGWLTHLFWLGPLVAIGYIAWVYYGRRDLSEMKWVLLAGVIGWGIETLHQNIGVITYHSHWAAPWWLVPLWGSFAICCGLGLTWIKKTWVSVLLGAVGGPLTYMAACGADNQILGVFQMGFLTLEWAILFPAFCVFFQTLYSKKYGKNG